MSELRQYLEERVGRIDTPCWSWRGYRNKRGYPVASHADYKGYAHRLAYELLVGPIPEGMELHHRCYNRSCINPEHLQPVTRQENMDASRAPSTLNKQKTKCDRGHPFDEKNTGYSSRKGRRYRYCKTCRREKRLAARRDAGLPTRDKWLSETGQLTHCPQGHPYAGENLIINSRGYKICQACRNERARERQRQRIGFYKRDRTPPECCPHGHPWSPENTYVTPSGGRYCRACNREAARRRHARLREG